MSAAMAVSPKYTPTRISVQFENDQRSEHGRQHSADRAAGLLQKHRPDGDQHTGQMAKFLSMDPFQPKGRAASMFAAGVVECKRNLGIRGGASESPHPRIAISADRDLCRHTRSVAIPALSPSALYRHPRERGDLRRQPGRSVRGDDDKGVGIRKRGADDDGGYGTSSSTYALTSPRALSPPSYFTFT